MADKDEKSTVCAVGDEELSAVSGGMLKEMEMVGRLKALGDVSGYKDFFYAAANALQDAAVLNA